MLKGALAPLLVLTSITLIVGVGLCLFDSDDPAGGDICFSLLAATVVPFSAFALSPMGHLSPARAGGYRRYPPDLPAPPPKA